MIRLVIIVSTLYISGQLHSQSTELKQYLISSCGSSHDHPNGKNFSYSIGEPVTYLGFSPSLTISQGFHQKSSGLEYSISVTETSCEDAEDGSIVISDILGCEGPYSILFENQIFDDTVLTGLSSGDYGITLLGTGCGANINFTVLEGNGVCQLTFFNGFSPNDDGFNDDWIIQNIELEEYRNNKIQILNKWGVLIWEASNYNNSDIVFKGIDMEGNALPDATYFYFLSVNDQEYTGFIELLR